MWRFTVFVLCAVHYQVLLPHLAAIEATNLRVGNVIINNNKPQTKTLNDIDSDGTSQGYISDSVPINLQFPHAVLFSRTCGGSIISPTWILTAAHCLLFMSGDTVIAGTNVTHLGQGVRRSYKRLIFHPRFSIGPYWLDAKEYGIKQVGARFHVLLAELADPLPLDGTTIAAIPLDDMLQHPEGLPVGFAGFGTDRFGGKMSKTMHKMDLETISDETCSQTLVEFDKQDMICTKGRLPRRDSSCSGDSGSGLVHNGRLIGVASWTEEDAITCRPGTIVVFSKVAAVRDWIKKVTGI